MVSEESLKFTIYFHSCSSTGTMQLPLATMEVSIDPTADSISFLREVSEQLYKRLCPTTATSAGGPVEFSAFGSYTRMPGIGSYCLRSFNRQNLSEPSGPLITSSYGTVKDIYQNFGSELFVHWVTVGNADVLQSTGMETESMAQSAQAKQNLALLRRNHDQLKSYLDPETPDCDMKLIAQDFFDKDRKNKDNDGSPDKMAYIKMVFDYRDVEYQTLLDNLDLETLGNESTVLIKEKMPSQLVGIIPDRKIPEVRCQIVEEEQFKRLVVYAKSDSFNRINQALQSSSFLKQDNSRTESKEDNATDKELEELFSF